MTCPSCRKVWASCQCSQFCKACGGLSNHTTRMHLEATRRTCDHCGAALEDPQAFTCAICLALP